MARAKLSALLTDLTGRYGGGVFRSWKGITTLSALPSSVDNPNSAKQNAVRSALSYASKLWSGLAEGRRAEWESVAEELSRQWDTLSNEVGTHQVIRTPRGPFTGIGALTSVVNLLISTGDFSLGDAAPAPPISATAPVQPTDPAASGNTDAITVTWSDPVEWGDQATTGNVRVWAKSDDGVFFPQLVDTEAEGGETLDITELVPRGGDAPVSLTPGFYWIQVDAVNDVGFRSAPSSVVGVIIDDPV